VHPHDGNVGSHAGGKGALKTGSVRARKRGIMLYQKASTLEPHLYGMEGDGE
jgi:hypothetical protein